MLTASFAVSLHVVWTLSYVWAIPAGTVIGFLGTDMIHGIIVSMLEAYANRQAGGYGGRMAVVFALTMSATALTHLLSQGLAGTVQT